jgi:hypothetical protein
MQNRSRIDTFLPNQQARRNVHREIRGHDTIPRFDPHPPAKPNPLTHAPTYRAHRAHFFPDNHPTEIRLYQATTVAATKISKAVIII